MMAFEWTVMKFLWYLFFMYFTLLYFTLYGMMTVALTPNHHIGSIVSSAFYAIWNLFSGFIVPQTVTTNILHPYIYRPCTFAYYIYTHKMKPLGLNFLSMTENSNMVEMVLLGLPCCLDLVWIVCFTIWRCQGLS